MKTFYRYLRPVRFNNERMEFDTQPKGGICLRFQETPDGKLWFTFSRCHDDDHFNKATARKFADARAAAVLTTPELMELMPKLDYSEAVDVLSYEVLAACRNWDYISGQHPLVVRYISTEFRGFGEALERLLNHNERECEHARIWYTAVGATELSAAYHRVMQMPEITPFGIKPR